MNIYIYIYICIIRVKICVCMCVCKDVAYSDILSQFRKCFMNIHGFFNYYFGCIWGKIVKFILIFNKGFLLKKNGKCNHIFDIFHVINAMK